MIARGKFYVYEHIRNDIGSVFYVGKGTGGRASTCDGRNIWWNAIVRKHGRSIRMVAEGLNEELAFLVEIERIDQLRRIGVVLTNQTDGGEGASGYSPSLEVRRKMSVAMSGENNPMFGRKLTDEAKQKISITHLGRTLTESHRMKLSLALRGDKHPMFGKSHSAETKARLSIINTGKTLSLEARLKIAEASRGRTLDPEAREKIAASKRGKPRSPEAKANMSKSHIGKRHTEETRAKMATSQKERWSSPGAREAASVALSGEKNPRFGKTHSAESRNKMSLSRTGKSASEETRRKMSEAHKAIWARRRAQARREVE